VGLFNKILGEAMIYTESFGITKKLTYEQALDILLRQKPGAVDLAKAENTMVLKVSSRCFCILSFDF